MTGATQLAPAQDALAVELDWSDDVSLTELRRLEEGALVSATTYGYGDCTACDNDLARITHMDGARAVLHDIALERTPTGRVTRVTDDDGVHDYSLDGHGQLLGVSRPAPLPDEWYRYDRDRNRIASHLSSDMVYDGPLLMEDGTWSYAWDRSGRLVEKVHQDGSRVAFSWDHRSRLTRVVRTNPGGEVDRELGFTYDPLDRAIAATVDGARSWTVYDGANRHMELDDAGQVLRRYFNGRHLDAIWAVASDDGVDWLLTDHVKNVRDVLRGGEIVDQLTYDAFGRVVSRAGSDPRTTTFNSRPFDSELGLGFYRARVYDPEVGRFISEDPLPPYGYAYANNEPTTFSDPTGESVAFEFACTLVAAFGTATSAINNLAAPLATMYGRIAWSVRLMQPVEEDFLNPVLSGIQSTLTPIPGDLNPLETEYVEWVGVVLDLPINIVCGLNSTEPSGTGGPPSVILPSY